MSYRKNTSSIVTTTILNSLHFLFYFMYFLHFIIYFFVFNLVCISMTTYAPCTLFRYKTYILKKTNKKDLGQLSKQSLETKKWPLYIFSAIYFTSLHSS